MNTNNDIDIFYVNKIEYKSGEKLEIYDRKTHDYKKITQIIMSEMYLEYNTDELSEPHYKYSCLKPLYDQSGKQNIWYIFKNKILLQVINITRKLKSGMVITTKEAYPFEKYKSNEIQFCTSDETLMKELLSFNEDLNIIKWYEGLEASIF